MVLGFFFNGTNNHAFYCLQEKKGLSLFLLAPELWNVGMKPAFKTKRRETSAPLLLLLSLTKVCVPQTFTNYSEDC